MKLSRLYCSDFEVFSDINFNAGLNVVFARVKDYSAQNQDSHNLGKTFLTRIIDFCLLSKVLNEHPFKVHADRFEYLEFFLEIENNLGEFITVRRKVRGDKSVFIDQNSSSIDLRGKPDEDWKFSKLGRERGKNVLNSFLKLDSIEPYDFRKGLGYFLRRQNDYDDLFRITRFGRGKDMHWKPFMALLLGFNAKLISEKFYIEEDIKSRVAQIKSIESDAGATLSQLDEVRSQIQVLEGNLASRRSILDNFSFYEEDLKITLQLVETLEKQIGALNTKRYTLMSRQETVIKALETNLQFDLDQISKLFEESGIYFSDQLVKDYSELVSFNRELTESRRSRLYEHESRLRKQISDLSTELQELDRKRSEYGEVLQKAETFAKFKSLQSNLMKEEDNLIALRVREQKLDATFDLRADLRKDESHLREIIAQIEDDVESAPAHYLNVKHLFSENAREILDVFAYLSVYTNQRSNIEFSSHISKDSISTAKTSEADGFSYQKLLCVCFDLALLCAFSDSSFYRFVYHDGVFETLDDRRKVGLLERVRTLTQKFSIQYILTVIDSDLPRSETDSKLFFTEEEVILELHDGGDDGRLLKGPVF